MDNFTKDDALTVNDYSQGDKMTYTEFVSSLISPASIKDFDSMLGTAGLGLAGEAGEVADIAKKVLYHGMEWNEAVKNKMILEAGDVMFYMTFLCKFVFDMPLEEVIQRNIEKLSDRYKSGKFSVDDFMAKEAKKVE